MHSLTSIWHQSIYLRIHRTLHYLLYGSNFSWDNIFVNFGNTLGITKIFNSKILVFCIRHVFSMSLFKYFKLVSKNTLPSPTGNLSHTIPSSSIAAANKEVSKVLPTVTEHPGAQSVSSATQHGCYSNFTPKQKATIGNYAVLHGPSAALWYFKKDFPTLKWSTVNDWKNAIIIH